VGQTLLALPLTVSLSGLAAIHRITAMPKFLLVDDDEDLLETLKEWFEMEGHDVETASTGQVALEKMKQGPHDLIILDWQLPEMEGVEVCRAYRAAGGRDRVLMLTGKRDASSAAAGKDAGASDFLPKPFTLDQLMERVQSMLMTAT
jgi:two-component system response regulator MprA